MKCVVLYFYGVYIVTSLVFLQLLCITFTWIKGQLVIKYIEAGNLSNFEYILP